MEKGEDIQFHREIQLIFSHGKYNFLYFHMLLNIIFSNIHYILSIFCCILSRIFFYTIIHSSAYKRQVLQKYKHAVGSSITIEKHPPTYHNKHHKLNHIPVQIIL